MKTKKMNKVVLFSLCAMFAACSEYDPADMTVQQAKKINEYSKNFEAKYGKIDPNHTWGFGSVGAMSNMSTRIELAREIDDNGKYNYNPPAPIDKEGDDSEYNKVLNAFQGATESDDVYFIWGTYYVQNVHSNTNVNKVYFAARDYKRPSKDGKPNYSKTSDENSSGLNSKNTLSDKNKELYKDSNGDSFTMFAGMGYDSEDENPQFKCVDGDGNDLDNCKYIILLIDGSFYVGFDLGSGNYTDWIVKIIPSGGKKEDGEITSVRIMCEDLGSTYDIDFNDIVFDVDLSTYDGDKTNGYSVTVTVQAAGGTLPVFIGNTNTLNEIHRILLGRKRTDPVNDKDTATPINVGVGTARYASKPKTISGLPDKNPASIPLYVINTKGQVEKLPFNCIGEAPFKICVPVGTSWTKEHQNIGWAYTNFGKWVQNEDYENNFDAGFSDGNKWPNTDLWNTKNEQYLMGENPLYDQLQ